MIRGQRIRGPAWICEHNAGEASLIRFRRARIEEPMPIGTNLTLEEAHDESRSREAVTGFFLVSRSSLRTNDEGLRDPKAE